MTAGNYSTIADFELRITALRPRAFADGPNRLFSNQSLGSVLGCGNLIEALAARRGSFCCPTCGAALVRTSALPENAIPAAGTLLIGEPMRSELQRETAHTAFDLLGISRVLIGEKLWTPEDLAQHGPLNAAEWTAVHRSVRANPGASFLIIQSAVRELNAECPRLLFLYHQPDRDAPVRLLGALNNVLYCRHDDVVADFDGLRLSLQSGASGRGRSAGAALQVRIMLGSVSSDDLPRQSFQWLRDQLEVENFADESSRAARCVRVLCAEGFGDLPLNIELSALSTVERYIAEFAYLAAAAPEGIVLRLEDPLTLCGDDRIERCFRAEAGGARELRIVDGAAARTIAEPRSGARTRKTFGVCTAALQSEIFGVLTLEIPWGEVVLLNGEPGAGKTIFLDELERAGRSGAIRLGAEQQRVRAAPIDLRMDPRLSLYEASGLAQLVADYLSTTLSARISGADSRRFMPQRAHDEERAALANALFNAEAGQCSIFGTVLNSLVEGTGDQLGRLLEPLPGARETLALIDLVGAGELPLTSNVEQLGAPIFRLLALHRLASEKSRRLKTLYLIDRPCLGLDEREQRRMFELLEALAVRGNGVLCAENSPWFKDRCERGMTITRVQRGVTRAALRCQVEPWKRN